jgi:hypothetical protein
MRKEGMKGQTPAHKALQSVHLEIPSAIRAQLELVNFRPLITHHKWQFLVWLHRAAKGVREHLLVGQLWKDSGALKQKRQFSKPLCM